MSYFCVSCSDDVPQRRWLLGYHTCLACGEQLAKSYKHCIVPLAKSNYQPVTDLKSLKQLNKYTQND